MMRFVLLFALSVVTVHSQTCPTAVGAIPESCTNNQYTTCSSNQVHVTATIVGSCVGCDDPSQQRPGFFCNNTENILCEAGYYCPFNTTSNSYDHRIECPEDNICFAGFTSPHKCREGQYCAAGATSIAPSWGALVAILWITLLMSCVFCCVWRTNLAELKRSQAAREAFEVNADEALGADFADDTPSVEVEFINVGMTLRKGGKCILKGVTGRFPPASLIALMGPSGGGKTTFMNALLGRAAYANVTGTIKVNGVEGGFMKAKNRMGFVPQDDILHCDLTVFQNLWFNALLRLPADKPKEDKLKHVEQCIKVLGIAHIQDDVVGSPESRGISGGQKKRVNIGCELVSLPAVVFMDEPTSGLDGAATLELARCLQQLRESGLTICCVIHQPRASVFNAFTHVLLLGAGGEQVYCGRTEFMERYLTMQKFRMPRGENAADWMIDVVCNLTPRYKHLEGAPEADADEVDTEFNAPKDLFEIWDRDHKATSTDLNSEWMKGSPLNEFGALQELEPRDVPGYCSQFQTLLGRVYRQHDNKSMLAWSSCLFFASVCLSAIRPTEYKYGQIFSSGGSWGLFNLIIAVKCRSLFGDEQLTYYRECKTGISSTAYWLAKNAYSVVIIVLLSLCWAIPHYFLNVPMQEFGALNQNILLCAWYWSGSAMFLSTAWTNQSSVTLALIMWNFLEMLVDGSQGAGIIEIADMNPVMWFISTLTCGRWQHQAYFSAEVYALPAHTRNFTAIVDVEHHKEIPSDLKKAEGEALLYMFIMGLAWRLLAWLFLALIKHAEGQGFFGDVRFVIASTFSDAFDSFNDFVLPNRDDVHLHDEPQSGCCGQARIVGGEDLTGGAEAKTGVPMAQLEGVKTTE